MNCCAAPTKIDFMSKTATALTAAEDSTCAQPKQQSSSRHSLSGNRSDRESLMSMVFERSDPREPMALTETSPVAERVSFTSAHGGGNATSANVNSTKKTAVTCSRRSPKGLLCKRWNMFEEDCVLTQILWTVKNKPSVSPVKTDTCAQENLRDVPNVSLTFENCYRAWRA